MNIAKNRAKRSSWMDVANHLLLITIICIVILYIVFAIFPFYSLGIHLKNPDAVLAGHHDPKAFYTIPFTHYLAFVVVLYACHLLLPPLLLVSLLLFFILRHHQSLTHNRWSTFVLSVGVLTWLFIIFTPLGNLITAWILD